MIATVPIGGLHVTGLTSEDHRGHPAGSQTSYPTDSWMLSPWMHHLPSKYWDVNFVRALTGYKNYNLLILQVKFLISWNCIDLIRRIYISKHWGSEMRRRAHWEEMIEGNLWISEHCLTSSSASKGSLGKKRGKLSIALQNHSEERNHRLCHMYSHVPLHVCMCVCVCRQKETLDNIPRYYTP